MDANKSCPRFFSRRRAARRFGLYVFCTDKGGKTHWAVSEEKKKEKTRAQRLLYRKKEYKTLSILLRYENDEDIISILKKSGRVAAFVREKAEREGLNKGFVKGTAAVRTFPPSKRPTTTNTGIPNIGNASPEGLPKPGGQFSYLAF